MKKDKNVVNKDYSKFTKVLRIIGIILIITGITLSVIAVSNMMSHSNLFFLGFIGLPLIFVGLVCTMFGFMKKFNSFTASQVAPVQKDVANYMLDGTREEMGKTAKTIFSSIDTSNAKSEKQSKRCPRCGELNDSTAKFCDNCGTPLVKICPKCKQENDPNAIYCDNCGTRL